MLLAIAVCPLWVPHWWESNRHKLFVSAVLGLPVLAFYGVRHPAALRHTVEDYVSFIILLAGLYVISGGILLRGDLVATPATNAGFLALGGVLASFVGTTGASMLLVRPLLQTNRERTRVKHTVVFFIFIVSNVGGMLTPLGDPPLFLGYLAGVPFTWTFRLWPHWGLMLVVLLAAFFAYDSVQFGREPLGAIRRDREASRAPARTRRPQRDVARRRRAGGRLPAGAVARAGHRGARRRLAAVHAEPDPPRQRLLGGADGRGGGAVRRDLPHHDPRAGSAPPARRRAGRARSPGSSSGRPARCRRSWTTRRPI